MESRFILNIIIVISTALMMSCSNDNINDSALPDEPTSDELTYIEVTTSPVIETNQIETDANENFNDFGLRLFDLICNNKSEENIAVSPLSASIALAMMANAGDDDFAKNIYTAMGCKDMRVLNSLCRKLMMFLPDNSHECDISIANALWHSTSLKPTDTFTDLLGQNYFADVNALEFSNEHAADIINQWVDFKTNGMIKDFVSDEFIKDADLCGVNAVYFNGGWAEKFDKAQTCDGLFKGTRNTAEVKFMSMSKTMQYGKNDKGEWIYFPYSNNDYVFIAALPDEGCTVTDFVKSFKLSYLNCSLDNEVVYDFPLINLGIPRFETNVSMYLEEYFRLMDIPLKTHGLTGMTSEIGNKTERTFVVKHKTMVKVDEDGSSASSASGILYPIAPDDDIEQKVIDLKFDRPFVYFICNTKTSSILIAGVISQL